jgi:SNF2 family DNA or RNA helicase
MEPNCQNIFCSECLLTWLKNHSRCPLCRTETDFSKFIYIQPTRQKPSIQEETNNETLTQIDTVIKIINSNPSGRIILFSCWDETFIPIRSILTSNDITFGEVKGTVEARNNLIQKFKNGEVQVIFLNANFNGAGINLQETTDIIVFHEMHNSLLTQIIGRANRIGRTNSLTVHHLQLI